MSKDSRWREGQPLLRAWSLVLHAHLRPSLPCGLGQVSANLRRPPPPPRGLSSLVFPGDWTARRTLGVWFPRPALTLRHPPPDPRQPWPCIYYSHDFSLSGSAEAGSLAHIFINPAAQK